MVAVASPTPVSGGSITIITDAVSVSETGSWFQSMPDAVTAFS
jgi:hypothetical protein